MGATGTAGINGANGTNAVVVFASAAGNGAIDAARSRNIASITRVSTGVYTVATTQLNAAARDLSGCVAVVQSPTNAGVAGHATSTAAGAIDVATFDTTKGSPLAIDSDFVVTVSC